MPKKKKPVDVFYRLSGFWYTDLVFFLLIQFDSINVECESIVLDIFSSVVVAFVAASIRKMTSEKGVVNDNDEKGDGKAEKIPKPKLSERLNINLSKKTKVKVAKYLTIEPILFSFLFLYLKSKLEGSYDILKVYK